MWASALVSMLGGAACGTSASGSAVAPLATPCSTDADCGGSELCHVDELDYVGHHQCAAACHVDADCSAYGAKVTCVGSSFCAPKCTANADCPTGTLCNPRSWCERTGPASGNPYCASAPSSCGTATDPTACTSTPGCAWASCTGTATACATLTDASHCGAVAGCAWDAGGGRCSGTATACLDITDATVCASSGCTAGARCAPTAPVVPCTGLAISACATVAGCQVDH